MKVLNNYAHLTSNKYLQLKLSILLLGVILIVSQDSTVFAENPALVDIQPPEVTIVQPLDGETLTVMRPWLEVHVTDRDSGINLDGIRISVDGVDVTSGAIIERMDLQDIGQAKTWRIRYQPPIPLASGQHQAQVDVSDTVGNITRRQWRFYIQVDKPEVSWDAGLSNSLSYSYRPLEKFDNTSNFTSQLQIREQRMTLQFQASAADYPGLRTKPNWGDYYLYLDQYTFGWQSKHFDLQYGNLNLPFESNLLQFGLGFEGVCISDNAGRGSKETHWTAFRGTTGNSFGFNLVQTETTGGIYHWQTEKSKNMAYFLQIENSNFTKVMGFQNNTAFEQGILRYEMIYGQENEVKSGGGIRVQGGTFLADIFWDVDWMLFQSSYPLPDLSPLSSCKGGAYQYTIRGDKLLSDEKALNFAYSQLANNLDGSADHTQRNQSLQLNYSGLFAPGFGWLLGYQSGWQQGYTKLDQRIIKLGINRKLTVSSWDSNLWLQEDNSATKGTAKKYQWNIGYTKPFIQSGLRTTTLFQLTHENKFDKTHSNDIELRATAEKQFFQDLAKSYLVIAYIKENEEDRAEDRLDIEGTLNLKLGNNNSLLFNGKVSFWENDAAPSGYGKDYTFNLSWQSRFFEVIQNKNINFLSCLTRS